MSRFEYYERYLMERLDFAKEQARALIHDVPTTEDSLFDHYKVLLCLHYNLMFFDPRWDHYTLDEIALEWFILEEKTKTKDDHVSEELTTEYSDDLSAMADEMEGLERSPRMPTDEKTLKEMNDFMETGVFGGEAK